jgi:di/tricarboxylate transporter
MTPEIGYVLFLIVTALVLFATEIVTIDVVGVILLLALAVPGVLDPGQALAGFGSETILVLIGLFVLTAGIRETGVVERIGLRLAALGAERPTALIRALVGSATAISAFVSNTVTTAVLLPLTIGSARRAGISPARVLMPLAFASILAGSITLVATSTNLVISGALPEFGLEPIGFFELAPLGLGITTVGLVYLLFVAPRFIPDRTRQEKVESFGLRRYLAEATIPEGSDLAGKTLKESQLQETLQLVVLGLRRGDERRLRPRSNTRVREGDVLLIEGSADDILMLKDVAGIDIRTDTTIQDADLQSETVRIVEAMVVPDSPLIGRSPVGEAFTARTGLTALALHSPGKENGDGGRLSQQRLGAGDVLLLQGRIEQIEALRPRVLLNLDDVSGHHPRSSKGPLATTLFVAALALGASGILPMSIAFLLGALGLVLTRCLTSEEVYRAVDWRLMVLIGSMLAFGIAMTETGTSTWLAERVVEWVSPLGYRALIAAFFLLTSFLTQPMSNQAAAIIVLPVAIETARSLGLEPRPLVMAVTFAASCSFLTPLEPACVLVYGPGRYRFFDFFKVGAPLTLVVFAFCVWLIPVIWG